jgi:RNA polymerase sigma-70 factor (ECF subfamily)
MPTPTSIAESRSDAELVAAVLAGEREQFQTLVARYERPLLRLAKSRLGRHDWAEDAVQDAFLWAFKSLHSYDSRFSFRTWLWTILLNQCNRHYQRRMRQASVETETEQRSTYCSEASPSESLLAKERAEQLSALLAELPDVQADALRLRFFGGLKFQEIADVQGCSLTSAKNRVRFGLLQIAERLGAAAADWEH